METKYKQVINNIRLQIKIEYRMRDQYMGGKKYWKISHLVMVITSENIGFITSGRTVKKTSAILHYYSCLKKYLNSALFEKKQCNRVIALFQCAITNVWYIYYRERLILEGLGPYINNVDHFITECLYLIYIYYRTKKNHMVSGLLMRLDAKTWRFTDVLCG